MSALTYFLLKLGFLAVMWVFVFAVVFAIRSDLFGPRVRVLARAGARREKKRAAMQQQSPVPPVVTAPAVVPVTAPASPSTAATAIVNTPQSHFATAETAGTLAIVEGPRAGHEFALTAEPITIGRSTESSLVLRDDYTSTNHARIFLHNGVWTIEDQGSTNGTLLDGERITDATPIPIGGKISIGTSVLTLRRR